jgi:hypothetical protein
VKRAAALMVCRAAQLVNTTLLCSAPTGITLAAP